MSEKHLVYVSCQTYNQASYIRDTLDGFCIQQTSFPYVCGILDDASTDGEQEIIRQYLEDNFDLGDSSLTIREETEDYQLVFARHKVNINCFFAVIYLKYNHYSIRKSKLEYVARWSESARYHAVCEGDDYWIADNKLQLQFDFLETHGDYGLVYTNTKILIQKTGILYDAQEMYHDGDVTEDLMRYNFIYTLTVCYRASLLKSVDWSYRNQNFLMGDFPLWIELSRLSKVACIREYTTVYRRLENSASHSTSDETTIRFRINSYQAKLYFAEKYGYIQTAAFLRRKIAFYESMRLCLEKKRFKAIWKYLCSRQFAADDVKNFVRLCFH